MSEMASSTNTEARAGRNPLAAGGTHKGFSAHPGTFLTHTIPKIHKNTIVVAATHPSIQTGDQKKDGWFLSDFYAFNYLLRGAVEDQTWLTAADPEKLMSRWGDYLHGYPLQDSKVVLSRDLLARSEISPVTRRNCQNDRQIFRGIEPSISSSQTQPMPSSPGTLAANTTAATRFAKAMAATQRSDMCESTSAIHKV